MVAITKCFLLEILFFNISYCSPRYVGFKQLGNYYITDEEGRSNEKIYYLSMNFRSNWIVAKSFCSSYGMNLVSIESDHEAKYFTKACENNSDSFEAMTHVGFTSSSSSGSEKWFLTSTGKEVNYNLDGISELNSEGQCLALVKNNEKYSYSRISCYGQEIHRFICQRMIIKVDNWSDIFGR